MKSKREVNPFLFVLEIHKKHLEHVEKVALGSLRSGKAHMR